MIVYKINNGKIVGISRQANDYLLYQNEYSSDTWYLKPFFNGSAVVESITQQEIDDRAEQEEENAVNTQLQKELQDGIKASNELKVYLKRNLTEAQYKNARAMVRPVWEALRNGDWDIALDEVNAIGVTGAYEDMKAKILEKIQAYINQ